MMTMIGKCSRCNGVLTQDHHCQVSDEQGSAAKPCRNCGGDMRVGPHAFETIIAQAKRIAELEQANKAIKSELNKVANLTKPTE